MTTSSSLQPKALRKGGYGTCRPYFPQLSRPTAVVVQCLSGNRQPLLLVDSSKLLSFNVQTLVIPGTVCYTTGVEVSAIILYTSSGDFSYPFSSRVLTHLLKWRASLSDFVSCSPRGIQ